MHILRGFIKTHPVFYHFWLFSLAFLCFFTLSSYILIYPASDTSLYATYAQSFLQGLYHSASTISLPTEYPFLSILIFLLPLGIPLLEYQVAFMVCMFFALCIGYIYFYKVYSPEKGLFFLLLTLVGAGGLVLLRYDIVPALFVLGMIAIRRKSYPLSVLLLLAAVGFKLYALMFLPFLLLDQLQHESRKRVIKSILLSGIGLSALAIAQISLTQSITVFEYFLMRPIQIESTQASVLWIVSLFNPGTISVVYTFQSFNLHSAIDTIPKVISLFFNSMLISGYCFILYAFVAKKLSFISSCIIALTLLLCTAKVFSPQYILWLIPLIPVATFKKRSLSVLLFCAVVLTGIIYPFLYMHFVLTSATIAQLHLFMGITTLRNILLTIFLVLLIKSEFQINKGNATTE